MPIADTLGALDDLVAAGKVREIGCSNFTVEQLREAAGATKPGSAAFASVQNHFSLFHRTAEAPVVAECARTGLAFLPYFPLANGLLTGKAPCGRARAGGAAGRLAARPGAARRGEPGQGRAADGLRRGARPHDPRARLRLAAAHGAIASVIAGATTRRRRSRRTRRRAGG
ncbi:MAG: aldo/keto reductase [Anaerolineae bacterium]